MVVCSLDTETTGLKRTDEVISIGMVFVDYNPVKNTFEYITQDTVYNVPSVPISVEATRVHGMKYSDVVARAGGKTKREVEKIVSEYISNCDAIMGYNIPFDIRMLDHTFSGIPLYKIGNIIDVMPMITSIVGRMTLEKFISKYVPDYIQTIKRFEPSLSTDGFHSAAFDSFMTLLAYSAVKECRWI